MKIPDVLFSSKVQYYIKPLFFSILFSILNNIVQFYLPFFLLTKAEYINNIVILAFKFLEIGQIIFKILNILYSFILIIFDPAHKLEKIWSNIIN